MMRMRFDWDTLIMRITIILFWVIGMICILFVPYLITYASWKPHLNIITWTDMIDPQMLKQFEKETGIVVNLSYFDSNEELLIKLRATKGQGYDLVLPSDFIIDELIKDDLLKKIDFSKVTIDRINPRLLHQYFDPNVEYALPYYWAIYGIGVNKQKINTSSLSHSWKILYDEKILPQKIAVFDNARELSLIALQYLFGTIDTITPERMSAIQKLTIEQKKWVEAYTDLRTDYLLSSKICPVAMITTPFMFKIMTRQQDFDFFVPKEGSFMIVDAFIIPKSSDKEELAYQLINFLYKPDTIRHHFNKYTFFPATVDLKELLQKYPTILSIYQAHFDTDIKLDFFRNVLTQKQLNDFWIALKVD